jgi:hypothetical protein
MFKSMVLNRVFEEAGGLENAKKKRKRKKYSRSKL